MILGHAQERRPRAGLYFGKGAVDSLQQHVASCKPETVVVNATLTGVQHRNLEQALGVRVLDRVGLIIEIFAQRARTREARLQVELAALEYRATRLVRARDVGSGKKQVFGAGSEVVSARGRGRSGGTSGGLGGGAGAGETELQLQRRRVDARRKALLLKLADVRRTRAVQRAARRRSGKPLVAVVGYTNAGKSSLIEALTGADLGAADALFATLDATARAVTLPSGAAAILSDTVGFISDLPVQLLDAFKGTLEEAIDADLLLHVIDASSLDAVTQHATVVSILRQLGMTTTQLSSKVVEVYNKVDLLESACMVGTDAMEDSAASAEALSSKLPSSSEPSAHAAAAADQRHTPADLQDRPAAGVPPNGAWAVRQLQGRDSADEQRRRRHRPQRSGTAAGGSAVPQDRQHVPRPSRVHVSAATGAGLGLLLQEIDRKVSIRSGLDALAVSTAALGSRLLTQSLVGPPQMAKRPRHDLDTDIGGAWRPGWLAEGSPLAAHIYAGPR